ncbi:MAG: alpha-ketoglutarate-dependent dioxygenase AlkB [Mucilaginibacter sp.]|nr:alpha-ketoglutarate-dependent dioxygenase AlkB [Mucilaginibacter sp.]
MEQFSLFESPGNGTDLPADLMVYKPGVFDPAESGALLETFIHQIQWIQETAHMYGKIIKTPRLIAWHGDMSQSYSFSGNKYNPAPWTKELLTIKNRVEPIAGVKFNSVLLNYYRDGNDSVAWHSDDEYELGLKPMIASVSFGQARRFDVRYKQDHKLKYAVNLENGSLLLMKGDLQRFWQHRIAKSTRPMLPRVNLTFRVII